LIGIFTNENFGRLLQLFEDYHFHFVIYEAKLMKIHLGSLQVSEDLVEMSPLLCAGVPSGSAEVMHFIFRKLTIST